MDRILRNWSNVICILDNNFYAESREKFRRSNERNLLQNSYINIYRIKTIQLFNDKIQLNRNF
jgi:hypothetical protein